MVSASPKSNLTSRNSTTEANKFKPLNGLLLLWAYPIALATLPDWSVWTPSDASTMYIALIAGSLRHISTRARNIPHLSLPFLPSTQRLLCSPCSRPYLMHASATSPSKSVPLALSCLRYIPLRVAPTTLSRTGTASSVATSMSIYPPSSPTATRASATLMSSVV